MKKRNTSKGKPLFDLENFKELIEIIPSLQEAVSLGIERELKKPKQKKKILKMDRSFMQKLTGLIQGKWTVDILFMIFFLKEPYYNELRRSLPEINSRTLTDRLYTLEKKEIIQRNVQTERPIRVTYKLTKFGEGLIKLFFPLAVYVILTMENKFL
jgi:DNA-binding HxlR family transcriptional regulator